MYQTMSRFSTGAAVAMARSEERAMMLKDFIFVNECGVSSLRSLKDIGFSLNEGVCRINYLYNDAPQ